MFLEKTILGTAVMEKRFGKNDLGITIFGKKSPSWLKLVQGTVLRFLMLAESALLTIRWTPVKVYRLNWNNKFCVHLKQKTKNTQKKAFAFVLLHGSCSGRLHQKLHVATTSLANLLAWILLAPDLA